MRVTFAPAIAAFAAACSATSNEGKPAMRGELGVSQSGNTYYGWATYRSPPRLPCDQETVGSCVIDTSCSSGDPPRIELTRDAGTVTIHGTDLALEETGQLYLSPLDAPLLPGDVVEMSATGSREVPAHRGAVAVPEIATVLTPNLSSVVLIDRSEDFELTWTPVSVGSLALQLTVTGSSPFRTSVTCSVSAAAGRLVVPASALARLAVTDPASEITGSLSVSQGNTTNLRPSGWDIWLGVSQGSGGADLEVR